MPKAKCEPCVNMPWQLRTVIIAGLLGLQQPGCHDLSIGFYTDTLSMEYPRGHWSIIHTRGGYDSVMDRTVLEHKT